MTGINQFVNWCADKAKRTRSEAKKAEYVNVVKLAHQFKQSQPKRAPARPSNSPPMTAALADKINSMWAAGENTTEIASRLKINPCMVHAAVKGTKYEAAALPTDI